MVPGFPARDRIRDGVVKLPDEQARRLAVFDVFDHVIVATNWIPHPIVRATERLGGSTNEQVLGEVGQDKEEKGSWHVGPEIQPPPSPRYSPPQGRGRAHARPTRTRSSGGGSTGTGTW